MVCGGVSSLVSTGTVPVSGRDSTRWLGQGDFCEKTRPESFSDWRHSEFMLIMHRSVVTSVQTLHKRYLLAMGV